MDAVTGIPTLCTYCGKTVSYPCVSSDETMTCRNNWTFGPSHPPSPPPVPPTDPALKSIWDKATTAPADRMEKIVNRPDHYAKWKVEPITFIMENGIEFWRGNIIKYAARAGSKLYDGMDKVQSEITDLEKVRRYAEMRINQLKGCSEL